MSPFFPSHPLSVCLCEAFKSFGGRTLCSSSYRRFPLPRDWNSSSSEPYSSAMALSVSSLASCAAASTSTFLSGSTSIQLNRGESRVTCKKADIHPEFFEEAKVYCNGELVMTTGGTQKEYVVDVWSGNHPFYQGNKSALVLDADRVEKFRQRYGGINSIQEIPTLETGEIVFQKKKKGPIKGGKGGKK
uniref:Large ribosomal subunit protein bL31c n=2 Tax=Physcomitrium patens TaxID=3218 RepID=A0A7I4DJV1_PHYPA